MASHGVLSIPPPTAKKDELLKVFQKEIVGKRNFILDSLNNVKAKSDGIVFLDESSRPSPKKPKKKAQSKKLDDSDHSPSPFKSNIDERPVTPLSVSTHRLVSRLESLSTENFTKRIEKNQPKKNKLTLVILSSLFFILASFWIYLKFWFFMV